MPLPAFMRVIATALLLVPVTLFAADADHGERSYIYDEDGWTENLDDTDYWWQDYEPVGTRREAQAQQREPSKDSGSDADLGEGPLDYDDFAEQAWLPEDHFWQVSPYDGHQEQALEGDYPLADRVMRGYLLDEDEGWQPYQEGLDFELADGHQEQTLETGGIHGY